MGDGPARERLSERVAAASPAGVSIPARIAAIARLCPPAATICEVGYDRGLILWAAMRSHPGARGVGVEVQPASRTSTPIPPDLAERVTLLTGDGLAPFTDQEADGMGVILAGLGGRTIAAILERRPAKTRRLAWVLTCPSHLEADIRPALGRLGLGIADERLVFDRGRYYELVLSSPNATRPAVDTVDAASTASTVSRTWGPLLLGRPDPLMASYLDDQAQRFSAALARGLESYREGPKKALGDKLAMLGEARRALARSLARHPHGTLSEPPTTE